MDYGFAKQNGFDMKDYDVVYEGTIEYGNNILDVLFRKFNIERPLDFSGHSLSVSDVIELDGTNYYCDSWGWMKI